MRLYRKPFGAVDDFDEYAEVALLPRRVSHAEVFRRVRFNQFFQRGMRSVYVAEPFVRNILTPDVSCGDH